MNRRFADSKELGGFTNRVVGIDNVPCEQDAPVFNG